MSNSKVLPEIPSPEGHVCPHGMWHSTARLLEYVKISTDLASRLTSRPNHVAVFANITEPNLQASKKKTNFAGVPIKFPGNDSSKTNGASWDTIVGELLKLKTFCESGKINRTKNLILWLCLTN